MKKNRQEKETQMSELWKGHPLQKQLMAVHGALHRLWTKNVGTPRYRKKEWGDLERAFENLAKQGNRQIVRISDRDIIIAWLTAQRERSKFHDIYDQIIDNLLDRKDIDAFKAGELDDYIVL